MSATALPRTWDDAPPALGATAVGGCARAEASGATAPSDAQAWAGGPVATLATLDVGGNLRVSLDDGLDVVRPASWLRAAGDGRDAVDVVLRPGGQAVTVTWRDGRRHRFEVTALRTTW